tara:strand:- start:336 stop:1607 length:1272 start_codon:yes stop_codon:yes gene_type:complete
MELFDKLNQLKGMQPQQSPIGMPPVGMSAKDEKNKRLAIMLYALGGALRGKSALETGLGLQQTLTGQEKEKRQMESTVGYLKSQGATDAQINLFKDNPALANAYITSTFKPSTDRKIIKGGDGYNYYADTGERVLPGVKQTSNIEQQTGEYRNYVNTLNDPSAASGEGFLAYQDRNVKDSSKEPKYAKAADGFYRWIDGPNAGQKVFGDVERFDKDAIEQSDANPLGLSKKDLFDRSDKLSDDFRAGSKDFITIRDSMGKVLQSAINPSPFGDLSIIFSAMKVLDPGSVVRESEFKTVEKAAPYLTRLGFDQDKIEAFKAGKLLTPEQRADVVGTVLDFYQSSNQSQQGLSAFYSDRAVKSGLDPKDVIFDFGASVTPKIDIYNYVKNLYQLDNEALILESQNTTIDDEKKKLILKELKRREK